MIQSRRPASPGDCLGEAGACHCHPSNDPVSNALWVRGARATIFRLQV